MFQYVGGSVPVTAVAFAGQLLFAGEGGYLKVYNTADYALIASLRIFDSFSIHGLCWRSQSSDRKLLIWGGTLVTLVNIDVAVANAGQIPLSMVAEPAICPDWILDSAFDLFGQGDRLRIAAVTAHNSLLLLDSVGDSRALRIHAATAQSKSILYSATISWEDTNRILIASGTVFGQIIIWSVHTDGSGLSTTLHKVFTGHEGSPFGLCLSDQNGLQQDLRFVVSCSDDRTVRLWDLTDLPSISADPHAAVDYSCIVNGESEHTGYSDRPLALDTVSSGCIARAMGHVSRIWAIKILFSQDDKVFLASFGEDATCHIWRYDTMLRNSPSNTQLQLIRQIACHSGKNIWSQAIRKNDDGGVAIATGGADGSICLLSLRLPGEILALHNAGGKVSKPAPDKIRSYAFVSARTLVVTTNAGHVYELQKTHDTIIEDLGSSDSPRRVCRQPDLEGFCMSSSVPSLSLAFFAGKSGSVYGYTPGLPLSKVLVGIRKTAGLFAKSGCSEEAGSSALCLVTWLSEPMAAVVRVYSKIGMKDGETFPEHDTVWIRLPMGEVVTTFTPIASTHILVGLRSGSMAVYDINTGQSSTGTEASVLLSMHGDAITDALTWTVDQTQLVATTCRDGSFSIARLDVVKDTVKIDFLHQLQIPGLTEAHNIYRTDGSLLVAGFHRKHFVLWDIGTEQEVCRIDCGGSNRSWEYCPRDGNVDESIFAWTQASALHIVHARKEAILKINGGNHGREIKAIAYTDKCSKDYAILATGSEDTDIKLSRIGYSAEGDVTLRCMRTLRKHTTGVQDLCWSADGRRLVSSGGMEELFVWKVTEMPSLELGVVCESACPFTSAIPDLRITSISIIEDAQPETTDDKTDGKLVIAASRSDSTFHVYEYRPGRAAGQQQWICRSTGSYLTCSLTKVVSVPSGQSRWYMSTGTDGHCAMFPPGKQANDTTTITLGWSQRYKLHQSAVQCADMVAWNNTAADEGDCRVLVSGGDDNSLSISRMQSPLGSEGQIGRWDMQTVTIPRAHAAAVTAVCVVAQDRRQGKVWVVSAGLDQRLKLWMIEIDKHGAGAEAIGVAKLCNVHTAVADVTGICSWTHRRNGHLVVMVCGVGWEAWRVGLDEGQLHARMGGNGAVTR